MLAVLGSEWVDAKIIVTLGPSSGDVMSHVQRYVAATGGTSTCTLKLKRR
jgi:hypothetical protein